MMNKKVIFIILLFLITSGIFLYTVKIREPWFGKLSDYRHQWLTGSTLKFCKNWYNEGIFNLHFLMLENPSSVEFPTLSSREPYASYPPGALLPIFFLSKLIVKEPTSSLIMGYNLFNHFLIAFFLSLLIFFFLLKLDFSYFHTFLFSIIPILLVLLLPGPLYWHQNVYFSDQAVILPFVLFVFLEVIRENKEKKSHWIINTLQMLIFFWGTMTDWFFLVVAFMVYIKRILNNEMGENIIQYFLRSIKYWIPAILGLGLFSYQLISFGLISQLKTKFIIQTESGVTNKISQLIFFKQFWSDHIANNYGRISLILLCVSLFIYIIALLLIFVLILKKKNNVKLNYTLNLITVLLLPCFIQSYFVKVHSFHHDFSALKFSIPLATVPFILIPVLLCLIFKKNISSFSLKILNIPFRKEKKFIKLPIIYLILLVFISGYLISVFPQHKSSFPELNKSYDQIGEFISENTGYNDIVFSQQFEIPANPPQLLSLSMKRIYKVSSIDEIYEKVKNLNEDFNINIFFTERKILEDYEFQKLINKAYEVKNNNKYSLYKIKKNDFFDFTGSK